MSSLPGKTLYASGFDPRSIPNCALWLDAADRSALTFSGANVTQWRDKSSNAYTFSNSGTIGTTTLNNLNVLSMGVGQEMLTSSFSWRTKFTQFFVVSGNSGFLFSSWGGSFYRNLMFTGNGPFYLIGGGFGAYLSNTGGVLHTQNSYYILTSGYNNGTTITPFAQNGSNITTGVLYSGSAQGDTTYTDPVYINGNAEATTWGSNNVAEILHYNDNLTSDQCRLIEGYLASKWGLRGNLPVTHPYKSYPLYTRPFQPIDISGCQLWYDANDSSTMTFSGSTVTQWNDKSGNGRNLTGVGSPVLQSYSNNMNVMLLNNSPYFQNTGFTNSGPYAIFIVFKFNSFPAWVTLLDNVSPLRPFVGYDAGAGLRVGSVRYGGSATTNVEIWSLQYIASDLTTFNVNGTSTIGNSTGYGGVGHTNGIRVGFAGNNTAPMVGWIGEIIYYGGTLSTSDRQAVEGYLADKWRLRTNIPATHPYKLFPPLTPVFTPNQISNCRIWLDAADRSTFTLSGTSNVTTWASKTSIGTATTMTTPSPISSSLNGYNSIFFNANPYYNTSAFTLSNSTGTTWFTVYAITNTIGQAAAIFATGSGPERSIRQDVTRQFQAYSIHSGSLRTLSDNGALNTITMYNIIDTPSSLTWFKNGSQLGQNTASVNYQFNNSQTGIIGEWGGRFLGHIFEILIYDAPLSTIDRQMVEGYLAHKWGLLNNLPSTHPYKKIRP